MLPKNFTGKYRVDADGCWTWTAATQSRGYGSVGLADGTGKTALAHRVAYEHAVGPIPDGMTIDHLCRNRKCVNPDHLEVVTRPENIRRGTDHYLATNPNYPCGHARTPENTQEKRTKRGHMNRYCRECNRAAQRAYYARKNPIAQRPRKDANPKAA